MKFRDLSDATQAASHSLGSLAGWLVCDRSLNFMDFSEMQEILEILGNSMNFLEFLDNFLELLSIS